MTSNVGADMIKKNTTLGFMAQSAEKDYDDMKNKVMDELKQSFRPEFLNRIDEVIVFHSLKEEHIQEIVSLMAEEIYGRLKQQEIQFELTEEAKQFLAKEGFDPTYGARPLRRAIQRHIEDRLSEELLQGHIQKGDSVRIDYKEGKLTVERIEPSVVKK